MSDFRDIIDAAIKNGFVLDTCGTDERHYSWGQYTDLCGMSVEEAMEAEDGPMQKKNVITFKMQNDGSAYVLVLSATHKPTADVNVSFAIDGVTQSVTLPSGQQTLVTNIHGSDPNEPYATITSIKITSDDEEYKYIAKNEVQTGIFVLTIIEDGVQSVRDVKCGETVQLEYLPEKPGYEFIWRTSDGTIIENGTFVMPNEDCTVIGSYESNTNVVRWYVDGVLTYTDTYTRGEVIVVRPDETREGYTFSGWDTQLPAVMDGQDYDVRGTFTINQYTLVFLINDEPYTSITADYGTAISIPTPSFEGYTFNGWDKEVPATMPAEDITFYGTKTINQYTLTFLVNEEPYTSITADYGSPVSVPTPSFEGYTFNGWDKEIPATMPAEDITFYGTKTINQYTLTFLVNEEPYTSITADYGTPVNLPAPSFEGYTFNGWDKEVPVTMPAEDITFYGTKTINQYTLSFLINDEPYTSITADYGTPISVPTPSFEGYTFNGWDKEVPATMPAENVVFNGIKTINQYTLAFLINNEPYTSITADYGTPVSVPTPSFEGYTFNGWDKEVPATMPAENETFYGTKTINQYTLTFLINGEPYTSITADYGTPVSVPTPSFEGYTFNGWDKEVPATMPAEDITFYGTKTANQYTLTFLINDEPYTSITADYGTPISVPTPSYEGYTFSGWDKEVPATMPAENITFYGTKTINQYVATYVIDTIVQTSITYDYGATVQYPDIPKEGYTLIWDEVYQTMPASDITITGTYEKTDISVRLFYGSVPESSITTFNEFNTLNVLDYTFGNDSVMSFVVPASDDYQRAAQELDDDDFNAWMEAHMHDFYIMVPDTPLISGVTFKNSIDLDITDTMNVKDGKVQYKGINYTVYYRKNQTQLDTDSEPITITIILDKSSAPVTKHLASYFIDGTIYTVITYGLGEIILYPTVSQQGITVVWDETYELMPDLDITINGAYNPI